MQIVTDAAADIHPSDLEGLDNIHVVPLTFTLDGKTYLSGEDIDAAGYYELLRKTSSMPTTAQPSPGRFADLYEKLAKNDPEILSVHISSGLSGTINAASEGMKLASNANVTLHDSKTLSGAFAWQVLAAARAAKAGMSKEHILDMLKTIGDNTDSMFTLDTLKYLVHGGRVSHIQGMLAGILDIKPLIGVNKVAGIYEQRGRARTLKKALKSLVDVAAEKHKPGTKMRIQIVHGDALEAAEMLKGYLQDTFDCNFKPIVQIAPVLAAHTGPAIAGFAYAPEAALADTTL